MLTQTMIIDMGWTKAMIKKLLPEPKLRFNPQYGNYVNLWPEEIVMEAMKKDDFRSEKEKAEKRKLSAQKALNKRIINLGEKMSEKVKNLDIEVLEDQWLRQRTIWYKERSMMIDRRDYQRELYQRREDDLENTGRSKYIREYCEDDGKRYEDYFDEWGYPIETDIKINNESISEETMRKWIVEFIVNELSHFRTFAYNIRNMYGGEYATSRMKIALLERISEFYPKYKEECMRQKVEVIRHTGIRMEKDYLYA